MATMIREMYDVLGCFSTATHKSMCADLLRQLQRGTGDRSLAKLFADALAENANFNQVDCPFIPEGRGNNLGRNPVTEALSNAPWQSFDTSAGRPYSFMYLQREVPHLRSSTRAEQKDTAWIDYVARTEERPILGEVKWVADENPFYAFVQLLVYLSEIATPSQVERSLKHGLFGKEITSISAFDLHIVLGNFNDRGEKGDLIESTQCLAAAFKERLNRAYPEVGKVLGKVLCLSGQIEDCRHEFAAIKCNWIVG